MRLASKTSVWKKEDHEYGGLKFTFIDEDGSIALKYSTSRQISINLQFSTDGQHWHKYYDGVVFYYEFSMDIIHANIIDDIAFISSGNSIYFRAGEQGNSGFSSTDGMNFSYFIMTGRILASGNINSLLNQDYNSVDFCTMDCFFQLFWKCTSLITAPDLPSHRLMYYCYGGMFNGCTSLTSAPALPADNIEMFCYYGMFNNCKSLINAPVLSATKLTRGCYDSMFHGCASLVHPPELPANILADSCYDNMFSQCTSLRYTPVLSSTQLSDLCYSNMFSGCSSLISAYLPASILRPQCYSNMFSGCSSLSSISVGFSEWVGTDNWVKDVAASGVFSCPAELSVEYGDSRIPTNWKVKKPFTGLKFTALEKNSSVGMHTVGDAPSVTLLTSIDNGESWNTYEVDNDIILNDISDSVCFMAGEGGNDRFASGVNYNTFVTSGKIAASGNINSLLSDQYFEIDTIASNAFNKLFLNSTHLITAPQLPATQLNAGCYSDMFRGCTALVDPPEELPAYTVPESGYDSMFFNCTSLTKMPVMKCQYFSGLYACMNMFSNNSSLSTVYPLYAKNTKTACYYSMFSGCSSMKTAPEIYLTDIGANFSDAMAFMFRGCSQLSEIKIHYTGSFKGTNGNRQWVSGVSSNGTFYYNGDDITYDESAIPSGWTVKKF